MTKKEFSLFAMALKTYYPRESMLPNEYAMELWYRELQDLPFAVAEAALRKHVQTNKYSPTIAEIRSAAYTIKAGKIETWSDGWERVLKAIRRYGLYREYEALESLDELTKTVVKRLGFREICLSDNISADRANFRKIYDELARRQQEDQFISLPLMQIIQSAYKQIEERIDHNDNKGATTKNKIL